jgi:hypothetical protein
VLSPHKIDPESIYDDGALAMTLGVASASLARARRQGRLRYRRVGNRTLYLGRWIIDWLTADPASTATEAPAHAS